VREQEYEQQMADLTSFNQEIEAGSDQAQPFYTEALYIEEAKSNRIRRFLFLLERGDHDGALRTLESVAALTFHEEERASQMLLHQLLVMLQEYGERVKLIEDNAPFNDIKLSYLNENYGEALRNVRELQKEEFIKPLLTGIEGALYDNMEMKRQLEEDIALRKQIRELVKKAALLEKEGEYEKAIDTYESLLVFPLSSYDREYMLKRVHSLWLEVELRRVKREENTKAIKYLESARILNREGNEKEAIEYYRMLLTECPHSDFVSDAIDEIINLVHL
jgi:tetratricopeptide (TPR) repeat protein